MSDDEIIDAVLNEVIKTQQNSLFLDLFIRDNFKDLDNRHWRIILQKMLDFDIADNPHEFSVINATTKGRLIVESGGWLAHLKSLEEEALAKKEREDFQFKKEKLDYKLAEEMLADFPKTKRRANIATLAAIAAILFQIIDWIFFSAN
jgi:hypothetical protein